MLYMLVYDLNSNKQKNRAVYFSLFLVYVKNVNMYKHIVLNLK